MISICKLQKKAFKSSTDTGTRINYTFNQVVVSAISRLSLGFLRKKNLPLNHIKSGCTGEIQTFLRYNRTSLQKTHFLTRLESYFAPVVT